MLEGSALGVPLGSNYGEVLGSDDGITLGSAVGEVLESTLGAADAIIRAKHFTISRSKWYSQC